MQPVKTYPLHAWSQAEIFNILKKMLPRVAPLKVTGPVFMKTSLAQDLDFDSLDTIEMLISLNEEFSVTLDFETWLAEESEREDTPFTIRSLCQCIIRALEFRRQNSAPSPCPSPQRGEGTLPRSSFVIGKASHATPPCPIAGLSNSED